MTKNMEYQAPAKQSLRSWPQQVAFVLFCATSVQLVLLRTFVPVIPGLRVDVYSGLLCAITLACAVLTAKPGSVRVTWPELAVSLGLFIFATLSGIHSDTPLSSTAWALTWSANALGAFWSARILLNTIFRQKVFVWLCLVTMDVLILFGLWVYYFHGLGHYFVSSLHQLTNIILLLSFSCLALIATRKPLQAVIGASVLLTAYVTLYVCGIGGVEAAVLLPPVILIPGLVIMLFRSGTKLAPLMIALFCVVVTAHYLTWVSTERFTAGNYQQERIEFYPFSAHVAAKSPWVGIGLRTPREPYLTDYELRFTKQSKEQFAGEVSWLVTSQNMFLTFMTGFGIPFAVIYIFALVSLIIRLLRAVLNPPHDSAIAPLALLIPITGAILHYFMMDILIQPQIAWFFHALLALVPFGVTTTPKTVIDVKRVMAAVASVTGVVLFGILIGTHPALKPDNFPSIKELGDRFRDLPIISIIARPAPPQKALPVHEKGWIRIDLAGYEGKPSKWDIMCILDNSASMAGIQQTWNPGRIEYGAHAINYLAKNLPNGSQLAVRAFSDGGPFKRKGKDHYFRVSQIVAPWTACPINYDILTPNETLTPGFSNICNAIESSIRRDFFSADSSQKPRLLLFTDGSGECLNKPTGPLEKLSAKVILDTIILGNEAPQATKLEALSSQTGGFHAIAVNPESLRKNVDQYIQVLKSRTIEPILMVTNDSRVEVMPGARIEIPSGSYELIVPQAYGLDESKRKILEVKVVAGENPDLEVVVGKDGVGVRGR